MAFLSVSMSFGQTPPAVDKELAKASTTKTQASVHVIFREVVESKQQKDWTGVYNASVELYNGDKLIGTYRGSTLPNDKPPATSPAYEYSVVLSTGSLKPVIGECFYTWTRTLRADGKSPCLRLAAKVPTLNVGTARDIDKFASFLKDRAIKGFFQYAENILVHGGFKTAWRGSAGCLTIHPDDTEKFFESILSDSQGTLSLYRGIHDASTQTSYDY
jgi:hypothetical protein